MDFTTFLHTKEVQDQTLNRVVERANYPKAAIVAPGTERQRDRINIDWEAVCIANGVNPYRPEGPLIESIVVFLRLQAEHMSATRPETAERPRYSSEQVSNKPIELFTQISNKISRVANHQAVRDTLRTVYRQQAIQSRARVGDETHPEGLQPVHRRGGQDLLWSGGIAFDG